MTDGDLKTLIDQAPDHALGTLEANIWAGVAAREQTRAVFKAVFVAQTLVLAVTLAGSVLTGHRWAIASQSAVLGVFSPRTALAASTLLLGEQP